MSVSNWLRCKLEAVDKNWKNWKNRSWTYGVDLLRSAKCYTHGAAHGYLCSFQHHFMVLQEVNIDKVLSSCIFSPLLCIYIYHYPKQYKLSPNFHPSGHTVLIQPTLHAMWHVMLLKRWTTLQTYLGRVTFLKTHHFREKFGLTLVRCREIFLKDCHGLHFFLGHVTSAKSLLFRQLRDAWPEE